ncbi:MAG: serine/threonine-protein phosphatase [Gemmataceae bacterium]|nr:serine/threonine-protein phosphatase [Gemmataceae bacterium]
MLGTPHKLPASITERDPVPFRDGAPEDRAAWVKLSNLQRRILPQVAPPVPGYQQVLTYRPAFVVTGDYHDFFCRADGRTAVFVGDGSGHGPAASMLMAMMRTILHTHPDLHREPGETLSLAGRMFHQLIPSDLFMTGVYLVLGGDAALRTLQFLRAPTLLHDYHTLENAVGHDLPRLSGFWRHLVPESVRVWWYRLALERGYLDAVLGDYIARPFLRVFEWCDSLERRWTDFLSGGQSRASDRLKSPSETLDELS